MKKTPNWFPTYRANSIFEIPLSFYAEHGIKVVLSDLDNTLDDYRVQTPSPRTRELAATSAKDLPPLSQLKSLKTNLNTKDKPKANLERQKRPPLSATL